MPTNKRTPGGMPISEPYVHVRTPHYHEMTQCCKLVRDNWGDEAAERCREQFIIYWQGGKYAPVFAVAVDEADDVIGFAAYHRTMLMKGAYNMIWIVVGSEHQGKKIGKALTDWRLNEIDEKGDAQLILVVTQKTEFFSKFGFFKLHHLGNEWYLMIKLLTNEADI